MNCVQAYCAKHSTYPSKVFLAAKRCNLGHRELTLEEQKEACRDLGAFQVHSTIPEYVRRYCER